MDRASKLTILQGAGITVQMVNAQIAILTHNAAIALVIGSFAAGFQFVVQHLGNISVPEKVQKELDKCSPTGS